MDHLIARLRKRPALAILVAVGAFARTAAAQPIVVNIAAPTAGQAAGDSLKISGTTQSQFLLSEASGTVQAATGLLTISNGTSFAGTLDISTVPIGPQTLTVAVKDAYGTTGAAQVAFIHDRPPSVTVTSPLDRSVARPSIRVAATCTDLDMYGCTSIKAVAGATEVASGTTSLDEVVSLAAYDGQMVNLWITATDSAGMSTTVTRTLFVESSPRLHEVDAVEGQILDIDASRILYTSNGALRIRTRGTQNDTTVLASGAPSVAWLTTPGALWESAEWNGTAVTSLPAGQWIANGTTACGVLPAPNDRGTGVVRDLTTGVTTTVFDAADGLYASCSSVAANGDVAFMRVDGTVMHVDRYRAGSLTRLTDGTQRRTSGALTDGINVAYQHYTSNGTTAGLWLSSPSGNVLLAGPMGPSYQPFTDYAIAGGAAAYVNYAAGDPIQVFLRSASGTVAPVGAFATYTRLDWLGQGRPVTQGDIIHDDTVSVVNDGKRYLAKPGIAPDLISSALGGARYVGSDWHVVIGRHVFQVVPPGFDPGGPDAGPDGGDGMDAGRDDAGSPDSGGPDGVDPDADAPTGDASGSVPRVDGSSSGDDVDGGGEPGGGPGDEPDDGACSATPRAPIRTGVGPALLAVVAVLRLARRRRS